MKHNFDDKNYWEEYYLDNPSNVDSNNPSPFAKTLVERNLISNKKVIELGCGNGRDSLFFLKNEGIVTAIDQCNSTTSKINGIPNITSYSADFTNLPDPIDKFDVVYSRFTLHSIDSEGEKRTIKWAFENLEHGGLLCIEVRTLKDPIFGKGVDKGNNVWFYNNHHRRFVNSDIFKKSLLDKGFKLELFSEKDGYAIHPTGNPVVLRVIALKP